MVDYMSLHSAYYKGGVGNSVVSIVTSPRAVGHGVLIPAGTYICAHRP